MFVQSFLPERSAKADTLQQKNPYKNWALMCSYTTQVLSDEL